MAEIDDLKRQLDDARAELDRIRLTLDVVGTVDLETSLLNRTGILDAVERGRRWMARRGDIYGLVIVRFPDVQIPLMDDAERIELAKHIGATIAAGVRDVDDVGRIDDHTFGAVLADLKPGAIDTVAGRVAGLLDRLVDSVPHAGGVFKIGGIEVMSVSHTSGVVLDATTRLALEAGPNTYTVGQL